MARRVVSREQRQRMRIALQLLVLSGVIRPADMEPPYFEAQGTDAVELSESADHTLI